MAVTVEPKTRGDGQHPRPRPRAQSSRVLARVRVPWALLGSVLVVGCGVAFAAWVSAVGDRVPIVTTLRDVRAGELIEPGDLESVAVGSGGGAHPVGGSSDEVVGRIARVDIAAGTALGDHHVVDRLVAGAGRASMALILDQAAVPYAALQHGHEVLAVEVAPADGDGPRGGLEVWPARVLGVETLATDGLVEGVAVSLDVAETDVPRLLETARAGRVRLVLVPPGTGGMG